MGLWNWLMTGDAGGDELEQRALDVVDIGVAFDQAIVEATQAEGATLPAVYRAAQFIVDTVASLHMEQIDDRSGLSTEDTPNLLRAPNPFETYHEFMAKLVASMVWKGNAYLRPFSRDSQGQIAGLEVAHPDDVTVAWDRARVFPTYRWRGRPMQRDRDIFHIPLFLLPGDPLGKGPITAARLTLAGAAAEAEFGRTLFADNATPPGLIKVQGKTQAEVDEIQKRIDEKAAEGKRTPRVISNAEWEQLTINPVDAQFLESRQFSIQEIARLFGVPGLFLGVATGDSLTYSTTESLFRLFVNATLRPTYLERIEQTFSRMLVRGKAARFNPNELLRADIKARYEAHKIGLEAGFLTLDEVRREEGLPPLPAGAAPRPAPSPTPAANGRPRTEVS